jgi:hypothetical protein
VKNKLKISNHIYWAIAIFLMYSIYSITIYLQYQFDVSSYDIERILFKILFFFSILLPITTLSYLIQKNYYLKNKNSTLYYKIPLMIVGGIVFSTILFIIHFSVLFPCHDIACLGEGLFLIFYPPLLGIIMIFISLLFTALLLNKESIIKKGIILCNVISKWILIICGIIFLLYLPIFFIDYFSCGTSNIQIIDFSYKSNYLCIIDKAVENDNPLLCEEVYSKLRCMCYNKVIEKDPSMEKELETQINQCNESKQNSLTEISVRLNSLN